MPHAGGWGGFEGGDGQDGLINNVNGGFKDYPVEIFETIRAATDVGGTFTDLVYFVTDPAPARSRWSPRRPTRRRPTSSSAS